MNVVYMQGNVGSFANPIRFCVDSVCLCLLAAICNTRSCALFCGCRLGVTWLHVGDITLRIILCLYNLCNIKPVFLGLSVDQDFQSVSEIVKIQIK